MYLHMYVVHALKFGMGKLFGTISHFWKHFPTNYVTIQLSMKQRGIGNK